jgi:hypothetical protein
MRNMNNVFDKDYISNLIDPFLPGAYDHIMAISYYNQTPDLFLFMFRTTGKNNEDYYFVSVETDHISGEDKLVDTVSRWTQSSVIRALWPENPTSDSEPSVLTHGPYKAFLLLIERPKHWGYWSTAVQVNRGDDIVKKLKPLKLSEPQLENVQTLLSGKGELDMKSAMVYKDGDNMELFYN